MTFPGFPWPYEPCNHCQSGFSILQNCLKTKCGTRSLISNERHQGPSTHRPISTQHDASARSNQLSTRCTLPTSPCRYGVQTGWLLLGYESIGVTTQETALHVKAGLHVIIRHRHIKTTFRSLATDWRNFNAECSSSSRLLFELPGRMWRYAERKTGILRQTLNCGQINTSKEACFSWPAVDFSPCCSDAHRGPQNPGTSLSSVVTDSIKHIADYAQRQRSEARKELNILTGEGRNGWDAEWERCSTGCRCSSGTTRMWTLPAPPPADVHPVYRVTRRTSTCLHCSDRPGWRSVPLEWIRPQTHCFTSNIQKHTSAQLSPHCSVGHYNPQTLKWSFTTVVSTTFNLSQEQQSIME